MEYSKYQSREFYQENKNNLLNPILEDYQISDKFKESDDIIRFGKVEKLKHKNSNFWIVKIPKGLSVYQFNRASGLNHSDFPPLNDYLDLTYYSRPKLSEDYLNETYQNQIKYAYGVSPTSKSRNPNYNDRLDIEIKEKEIRKSSQFSAYLTVEDIYLLIVERLTEDIISGFQKLEKSSAIKLSGFIEYPSASNNKFSFKSDHESPTKIFLFSPREVLKRDRSNRYDLEHSVNYLGIVQEYRKFKTSNLVSQGQNNFHQGNLLEHNSWVGLVASSVSQKAPYTNYGSDLIAPKEVYILAGFLHDLGKSGECEIKPVYQNLNHQDAKYSICEYLKDQGEIIGMKYHTLPDHPCEGYEYMKGYKHYKRFTLKGIEDVVQYNLNAQKLYLSDWNNFFNHIKIDEWNKRLIRITCGAHWYFGDYLSQVSDGKDINRMVDKYLRKLEIFYNDEFDVSNERSEQVINREYFKKVCIFVVVVSISDIYGSEYNPERILSEDQESLIRNYLPNISLNNIYSSEDSPDLEKEQIVGEIIKKALDISLEDTNKRRIFKDIESLGQTFLNLCLEKIDNFTFDINNNYFLLHKLKKTLPEILKLEYPEFPKVIVFELDQTLLETRYFPNKEVEYSIYRDTFKVIQETQKLRELGVFIVLSTRHYAPKTLKKLLFSSTYQGEKNPLYYQNFDFIISRYTGAIENILVELNLNKKFFQYNGTPNDGFMMDKTGESFQIFNTSKFLELDKMSKSGHYDLIKRKYNISYSDILAFDSDPKYFQGEGLGKAESVFVAAVLRGKHSGIRYSLFREGLAFYIFNRLLTL